MVFGGEAAAARETVWMRAESAKTSPEYRGERTR